MKKSWKLAASGLLLLAFTALPALAAYVVLKDQFDPKSGTGIAVVQFDRMRSAEIWYRDMDASQSLTDADTRLRVRYLRHSGPIMIEPTK
jgi:hypothetical protein